MIKNIIIILFFSLTGTSCFSQFNIGAGTQVILDGTVIGFQGKALLDCSDRWRAATTFTYHLKSGINWTIDGDAHYKLLQISDNFDLSPFAGLSVTSFSVETEIGINVGAFIDFVPADSYHIYIEPKFNVGGYKSFVVSGGILF